MRMKVTAIMVAGFLALTAAPAMSATIVKIGVVDLQRALNATTEGVAAKESLRDKHKMKQDRINELTEELKKLEEKLQSPVISEEKLAQLKEEHRQKKLAILDYARTAKEEEDKENTMMSNRILKGLMDIVQEIAGSEGFTVVLEKNAGVVYFEETLDLTERAVKIYNQRSQSGEGK